jgi:hypothetical protein
MTEHDTSGVLCIEVIIEGENNNKKRKIIDRRYMSSENKTK